MTIIWISLALSIFGLLCTTASWVLFTLNQRRM